PALHAPDRRTCRASKAKACAARASKPPKFTEPVSAGDNWPGPFGVRAFFTLPPKRVPLMLDRSPTHIPSSFPAPEWAPDRWRSIARDYTPEDVARLAGSLTVRHTLAENG